MSSRERNVAHNAMRLLLQSGLPDLWNLPIVRLTVLVLLLNGFSSTVLHAQRLNPRDFFDGTASTSLEKAKELSKKSGKPVFAVVYSPTADRTPGMRQSGSSSWALGYFMELPQTRALLRDNFEVALVTIKQPGVTEVLGNILPAKPWLVVLTPDGDVMEKQEIYANPTVGLKIVTEILEKWHTSSSLTGDPSEGDKLLNPQESEPIQDGDKIEVNPNPSGMNRAGMLPVKDLVALLSGHATADPTGSVPLRFSIFRGLPILSDVDQAIEILNLPNKLAGRHEVNVPGWPEKSFFYRSYDIDQNENDGFNKLSLVTDFKDRVVSVILLDESPKGQILTPSGLKNWHTFDFVHNKRRLMTTYLIEHEIQTEPPDVMRIESSAFIASRTEAGQSRLVDRAIWYLPEPLAAIILHHSEALLSEKQ
jgi:hypothetical protein